MNTRELFLKIMRFERADRLPLIQVEGVEAPTLARWRREGLPKDTTHLDFFGMDRLERVSVDLKMLPRFETKVLEEDEHHTVEINELGIKTRYDKRNRTYLYGYLEHPVKNRKDWERMKERYDPRDPARYPSGWGPELIQHYREAQNPVGILIYPFFFRHAFYLMGMESFMLALHDQPDLIHDMFEFCANFCLEAVKPAFDAVPIDYAMIAEDLAYKGATHISPRMYREFWFPHQKKVMDFLKAKQVPVITMWSSGDTRALLPLMIELGYNATWPVEASAGLDVTRLAKEYGKAMRFVGNISIHSLIQGKEAIRKEVEMKVLPLLDTGGYIPAPDDIIPPEVPFEHYCYYIELLRKVNAGQPI